MTIHQSADCRPLNGEGVRMELSVIILAKNEENNIKDCIKSVLPLQAEIIVLDDGSTDRTCEFAEKLGARIEPVPKGVKGFGEKRCYATGLASHDVVFHLDSDERVQEELVHEIEKYIPHMGFNTVFEIPRLTYLFGRPIRHCGWYPDYVRRIYNRRHTDFTNVLVHESVFIKKDSAIRKFKAPILHFSYPTLESYYKKQAVYPVLWGRQKARQKKRTSLLSIPFRALFFFIKTYVIRLGFLDGRAGLWLSFANMSYECSKYLCLYEAQNENCPEDPDVKGTKKSF